VHWAEIGIPAVLEREFNLLGDGLANHGPERGKQSAATSLEISIISGLPRESLTNHLRSWVQTWCNIGMDFTKSLATIGLALSVSVMTIGGLAAQTSAPPGPASSTAPPAPPTSAASDTGTKPIKPMHEHYLLSHSSAVYAQADTSSAVIGHVHRKKHVTVTGLEGDWLQVTLPHGKVGYIPTKSAE